MVTATRLAGTLNSGTVHQGSNGSNGDKLYGGISSSQVDTASLDWFFADLADATTNKKASDKFTAIS
jgi:hypothetical protein